MKDKKSTGNFTSRCHLPNILRGMLYLNSIPKLVEPEAKSLWALLYNENFATRLQSARVKSILICQYKFILYDL